MASPTDCSSTKVAGVYESPSYYLPWNGWISSSLTGLRLLKEGHFPTSLSSVANYNVRSLSLSSSRIGTNLLNSTVSCWICLLIPSSSCILDVFNIFTMLIHNSCNIVNLLWYHLIWNWCLVIYTLNSIFKRSFLTMHVNYMSGKKT